MQYKLKEDGDIIVGVEARENELCNYALYAGFTEDSRLIFYGNLPDEICNEIIDFLQTQCIHIDDDGIAYQLAN